MTTPLRDRFEAWARDRGLDVTRPNTPSGLREDYQDRDADFAWCGWQAQAASQPAPGEAVSAVRREEFVRMLAFIAAEAKHGTTDDIDDRVRRALEMYDHDTAKPAPADDAEIERALDDLCAASNDDYPAARQRVRDLVMRGR